MSDFENRALKDESGNVIKYADGRPVLYKHFLNDLPDEEHEVFSKMSPEQQAAEYESLNIPIPDSLKAKLKDK